MDIHALIRWNRQHLLRGFCLTSASEADVECIVAHTVSVSLTSKAAQNFMICNVIACPVHKHVTVTSTLAMV